MIYEIRNEKLTVKINSLGAELISVIDNKTNTEFIWQGDKKYWSGHSPVLFPFCGRNKDSKYKYNGKEYEIKIHGLARYTNFKLHKQNAEFITLMIASNKRTLKIYPFYFEFYVSFILDNNHLVVEYLVKNKDSREMIFAYGFHPGFNVPINSIGNFEDYYLELSKDRLVKRKLIEGLDAKEDELVEFKNKRFYLSHEAFKEDQFYKSDRGVVTLKSNLNNNYITVRYSDMTSLGLWKVDNSDAPYLCIEPWFGFPGSYEKHDELENREEMIHLAANKEFKNAISIEFYLED